MIEIDGSDPIVRDYWFSIVDYTDFNNGKNNQIQKRVDYDLKSININAYSQIQAA